MNVLLLTACLNVYFNNVWPFYFTLCNVPPMYRSRIASIQVLVLVKSSQVANMVWIL